MGWRRILALVAVPVLLLAALAVLTRYGEPQKNRSEAVPATKNLGSEGFHPTTVDVPGNDRPDFVAPQVVQLAPHDQVIGIIVDGQPRAYVKRALSGGAAKHVVSDLTPDGRITVTHCDLENCTRVFVDTGQEEPIRVGGRREDRSLELIIDGQRYSQLSQSIPRDTFPYDEMSWQEWVAIHPETSVYLGGERGG